MKQSTLIALLISALVASDGATVAHSATVLFAYDSLNRITNVSYGNGASISYTYDASGNRMTYSGAVTNDGVVPNIAITSPTAGPTFITTNSTINLLGSASDNAGIGLIGWANRASGIMGRAVGTTSWSISGIALQLGVNDIVLTAQDIAGNGATTSVSVTYFPVLPTYVVAVAALPLDGGVVSGSGTFNLGSLRSVSATANPGFTFSNWTENGNVASLTPNYSFTVTNNRSLIANFAVEQATISVAASPNYGGVIGGGGTFLVGNTCTVTASANSGYTFWNWAQGRSVVSSSSNYTFTVTSNCSLVANFKSTSLVPPSITYPNQAYTFAGGSFAPVAGFTNIKAFAVEGPKVLAVTSEGLVIGNVPVMTQVSNAVAVGLSYAQAAALLADGTMISTNLYTEFGEPQPPGLTNVIALDVFGQSGDDDLDYKIALTGEGRVEIWGLLGYRASVAIPGAIAAAGGWSHFVVLRSDGTVTNWGVAPYGNYYGQLDIPPDLNGVVAVAAGGTYTLALKAGGTVVAWGSTFFGPLSLPQNLTNVVAIAAADDYSLALKRDGSLMAWSQNPFNGDVTPPANLTNVMAIAVSSTASMALVGMLPTVDTMSWGIAGRVSYYNNGVAVPDVHLALVSTQTLSAVSASNGTFSFTDVPSGAYTLNASKTNDFEEVSAYDLIFARKVLLGLTNGPAGRFIAGDVNHSGGFSITDLTLLRQIALGIKTLSQVSGTNSLWEFVPNQLNYNPLGADQVGQDFTAVLLGDVSGAWRPSSSTGNGTNSLSLSNAVVIGTDNGLPGSTTSVTARVLFKNVIPDVLAVDAILRYSPTNRGVMGVTKGALIETNALEANTGVPGIVRLIITMTNLPTGTGTLFEVTFPGVQPVTWELEKIRFNKELVPHILENGNASFDSDGDDLIDIDEVGLFHTNPSLRDSDNDGMSDGDEIRAGTDPNTSTSLLIVRGAQINADGTLTITWASVPGRRYRIEVKNQFDGTAWIETGNIIDAVTNTTSTVVESAPAADLRIFRVKLVE